MAPTEDIGFPCESPKRRAILNAATDLFAARGYGDVSMDAIAKAADVSKATLYAHFASKDRLFAMIVDGACKENLVPVDELPDGGTDIGTALRAIGGRMLRFFLSERSLAIHRLVVSESARFPELGQAFYANGPLAGRERFAAWMIRQPALSHADPALAAEQFFTLLRADLYLRATLGLGPEPAEAAIDAAVAAAARTFLAAHGARTIGRRDDVAASPDLFPSSQARPESHSRHRADSGLPVEPGKKGRDARE